MRNIIVAVTLLLVFGIAFGINLNIAMPEYMHVNTNVKSTITVTSSYPFDVVVLLPKDFTFNTQSTNTSTFNYWFETKGYSYEGSTWVGLHWHFSKPGSYKIDFSFTTPNKQELTKYELIYTSAIGQFQRNVTLIRVYSGNVPPPICGNGVCEPGENFLTCPSDCGGAASYVIDVLLIVGAILAVSSALIFYIRRVELERSIMSSYNIDKLIVYIRAALKAKVPEWQIKSNLYKMGWEPKVVEYILKRVKRENK